MKFFLVIFFMGVSLTLSAQSMIGGPQTMGITPNMPASSSCGGMRQLGQSQRMNTFGANQHSGFSSIMPRPPRFCAPMGMFRPNMHQQMRGFGGPQSFGGQNAGMGNQFMQMNQPRMFNQPRFGSQKFSEINQSGQFQQNNQNGFSNFQR